MTLSRLFQFRLTKLRNQVRKNQLLRPKFLIKKRKFELNEKLLFLFNDKASTFFANTFKDRERASVKEVKAKIKEILIERDMELELIEVQHKDQITRFNIDFDRDISSVELNVNFSVTLKRR